MASFFYSPVLHSLWPEHDRCNSKKWPKRGLPPTIDLEILGVIPIISEAVNKSKTAAKNQYNLAPNQKLKLGGTTIFDRHCFDDYEANSSPKLWVSISFRHRKFHKSSQNSVISVPKSFNGGTKKRGNSEWMWKKVSRLKLCLIPYDLPHMASFSNSQTFSF